jgi:hypothetical protein
MLAGVIRRAQAHPGSEVDTVSAYIGFDAAIEQLHT